MLHTDRLICLIRNESFYVCVWDTEIKLWTTLETGIDVNDNLCTALQKSSFCFINKEWTIEDSQNTHSWCHLDSYYLYPLWPYVFSGPISNSHSGGCVKPFHCWAKNGWVNRYSMSTSRNRKWEHGEITFLDKASCQIRENPYFVK